MSASHFFPLRVYYEDTDAGGVVYYANYLKFAERARTEFLREKGVNQSALDCFFVVRHVTLDLKAPARLDDLLAVETSIVSRGPASFLMAQAVRREDGALLAEIQVKIACVSRDFRPIKIPEDISELLEPCKKDS